MDAPENARQPSLPPDTTHQEDVTTAGQRRINLIWEYTQAAIALMVVAANVVVGAWHGLGKGGDSDYPFILSSSLFLVIGSYFSRTNHASIGGVGRKPTDSQVYVGR